MERGRRWGGGRTRMGGMKGGVQSIWEVTVCSWMSGKIYRQVNRWVTVSVFWEFLVIARCKTTLLKSKTAWAGDVPLMQKYNTKILTGREKETIDRWKNIEETQKWVTKRDSLRAHGAGGASATSQTHTPQGGWGSRLGRLHNVGLVKRPSRGIYGGQEQGHESDTITGAGATDRRSTVQWRHLDQQVNKHMRWVGNQHSTHAVAHVCVWECVREKVSGTISFVTWDVRIFMTEWEKGYFINFTSQTQWWGACYIMSCVALEKLCHVLEINISGISRALLATETGSIYLRIHFERGSVCINSSNQMWFRVTS